MKLINLLLLLLALTALHVKSYAQKNLLDRTISISFSDETIKKAIKKIEKEAQISFAYSNLKALDQKVSGSFTSQKLTNVLNTLLKDTNLSYKEVAGKIIMFERNKSSEKKGERHTINGYIYDVETGERLLYANVYNKTTFEGIISNTYGFYSLSFPEGETNLAASFLGYQSKEFNFNLLNDTTLNIELEMISDELEEVVVNANYNNRVEETQMSMNELSVQKIKATPVILGEADVLKVMQLLPGVKGGTEGTSGIYVRGGGSDQNLFLLDDVPVYNASHLLGFFSVFNPDAIKTVKLYKGGFPARYGGRLSSVVDVTMKDGNMKELHGDFSIGLISSKLFLEGPIKKDKTSFMLSARRTYLDILAQPAIYYLSKINDQDVNAGAHFHDYNLKINHIFSNRSRLYFSGYSGKDSGHADSYYTYTNEENSLKSGELIGLDWGNNIASLRWNYLLSKNLFSNTTITYSKYIFDVDITKSEENLTTNTGNSNLYKYYSGIEDIAAKIDFDYFPKPNQKIKFGTAYTNHYFTPGVTQIKDEKTIKDISEVLDTIFGNSAIRANEFSGYVEDNIELSKTLSINAGMHLAVFNVQQENYFEWQPRFSARYQPHPNWSLKASYSRMAQHLHLLATTGLSMPTDLWLPATKKFAPPVSNQLVLGTDINLQSQLTLSVEGYYKTMKNLIEYKEGASFTSNATDWESKVEQGIGWSYGAEFMLEKKTGKTTGWIAYTLSWSKRKFENLNFGNVFPDKYDNRHDISIAVTHEFSKRFDIGGTFVYRTGNAATLATMKYPIRGVGEELFNSQSEYYEISNYSGRNNYRMPAYHRLDIGANFHKQKKHGIRTWSFSLYNAYSRMNPFFLTVKYIDEERVKTDKGYYTLVSPAHYSLVKYSLFPIIPSISYSYKF
jgi:hypothetical protein